MVWTQPENERRTADRNPVSSLCIAPVSGTVQDLNGTGLSLETWGPLPIRADFSLTIGQVELRARLPCRVMWCHLVRTETTESGSVIPIYRSGVRFLRLDERVEPPSGATGSARLGEPGPPAGSSSAP